MVPFQFLIFTTPAQQYLLNFSTWTHNKYTADLHSYMFCTDYDTKILDRETLFTNLWDQSDHIQLLQKLWNSTT